MPKLYVLGGKQRKSFLKKPTEEWHWYESALILEVDTDSGEVRTRVEYMTPPAARASENSSINFHAGTLIGNTLYTCTTTEVLIFRVPEFEQVGYISLPAFNDVHHVTPCSDGNLLVVNTGLDMVIKCTQQGEVLKEYNVLGGEPWAHFSQAVDYRRVETTKPHGSHPNFVFELDGELWVTRFNQRDAISLNGSGGCINIATEKPHDGILRGDSIYFTTVDGKIIIANRATLKVDEIVDLRQISDGTQQILPAWCRGLLPMKEDKFWVGFTRIRKTQFKENVRWVKTVIGEGAVMKPTHIALYDLADRKCLKEIDLESHDMNAIYGIHPVPDAR
jgi:hypothetical protein